MNTYLVYVVKLVMNISTLEETSSESLHHYETRVAHHFLSN